MNKLLICAIALALLGCAADESGTEGEQPEESAAAEAPAEESPETGEPANDEPWPQEVRDTFLQACLAESNGEESYCVCVQEDLEALYTVAEFEQVERTLQATDVIPDELAEVIDTCIEANL